MSYIFLVSVKLNTHMLYIYLFYLLSLYTISILKNLHFLLALTGKKPTDQVRKINCEMVLYESQCDQMQICKAASLHFVLIYKSLLS